MWSTSWPTVFPCERARADTGGSTLSAHLAGPCLGTFVGVGVLLIGLGTAGVDTWRLVARTKANDVLSVGTGLLLLYLLPWLAIAYTTYRLQRRPPGPGTRQR